MMSAKLDWHNAKMSFKEEEVSVNCASPWCVLSKDQHYMGALINYVLAKVTPYYTNYPLALAIKEKDYKSAFGPKIEVHSYTSIYQFWMNNLKIETDEARAFVTYLEGQVPTEVLVMQKKVGGVTEDGKESWFDKTSGNLVTDGGTGSKTIPEVEQAVDDLEDAVKKVNSEVSGMLSGLRLPTSIGDMLSKIDSMEDTGESKTEPKSFEDKKKELVTGQKTPDVADPDLTPKPKRVVTNKKKKVEEVKPRQVEADKVKEINDLSARAKKQTIVERVSEYRASRPDKRQEVGGCGS
jgi:uncharacterized protein YoxC